MGEVIEVSMLSKTTDVINLLLVLLTRRIDEAYEISSIKAMDNWKYENIIPLKSMSDVEKYIGDKIICIEIKACTCVLGVSIEKKLDLFCIEGWINSKTDVSEMDYKDFLTSFIDNFKTNACIEVCGVGKEILVNYELGIQNAIDNAHNIDLWLLKDHNITVSSEKPIVIYINS